MSDELATTGESSPQRGLASVWGRIAPLSVGAIASSAVIIGASAVMRRSLGPRARVLGWVGTAIVLPMGLWLLTRRDEERRSDSGVDVAELPGHVETRELDNPES